jgi:hypothetical protein
VIAVTVTVVFAVTVGENMFCGTDFKVFYSQICSDNVNKLITIEGTIAPQLEFSQMVFVDFANPLKHVYLWVFGCICVFCKSYLLIYGFVLDSLCCGSKSVISSYNEVTQTHRRKGDFLGRISLFRLG